MLDLEWLKFCDDGLQKHDDHDENDKDDDDDDNDNENDNDVNENDNENEKGRQTAIGDIHISTKTKIVYLNQPVDLVHSFWNVPVMDFYERRNGVVKKQMKFTSFSQEEVDIIDSKMKESTENIRTENYIISSKIDKSAFKDIRRITIGVSKRDLLQTKKKTKSAFYNCFVLIIRLQIDAKFREFHVKIFNTGKLEIPGIQDDNMCREVMKEVLHLFRSFPNMQNAGMDYTMDDQNVLINSNFKAGFFINRERLYDILRVEYNINCIFDPCSYPGIQCKYYFENYVSTKLISKKRKREKHKVSFMIFRTGSVLIVGMCSDTMLQEVYQFIKTMLEKEYPRIVTNGVHLPKQQKRNFKKMILWREKR